MPTTEMQTTETNGQPRLQTAGEPLQTAAESTPRQKGGAKAAGIFWARYPTPEARSQLMRERFAKVKADRLKQIGREKRVQPPKKNSPKPKLEKEDYEDRAAEAIYGLRIMLVEILDLLDACNAGGIAGQARDIRGRNISSKCFVSAHGILMRGLRELHFP